MFHQIENIIKETEIIFEKHMEILKLQSKMAKIRNSLERLNNKFELVENRIDKFEYKSMEIMEFECKEEKKKKN